MIKEIFPGIFKLDIPLPNSPLGHLNSYLIKTEEEGTLIDTGLDLDESFEELNRSLNEIGLRPKDLTNILLTHFHIDHIGLVSRLKKISHAKIIFSNKEAELLRSVSSNLEAYSDDLEEFYRINGAPPDILTRTHTAGLMYLDDNYKLLRKPDSSLRDGEKISFGEYDFEVILTPGHSPGHICLYEPEWQFLIAGDHILPAITPNVTQRDEDGHHLTDYLNSLEKVERLEIKKILPGHEEIFMDHRGRIQELRDHHAERCEEILKKIRDKAFTAYQIASSIHWDLDYPTWDDFPIFQRWMAMGETLSHLKFLEERGLVEKIERERIIFYRAV
jgi:glyoxylase-like metal-dependent hydrolase (beta-lactamase superfamily II)